MKTFSCFALSTCLWFAENVLGVLLSYAPNVHPKQIVSYFHVLFLIISSHCMLQRLDGCNRVSHFTPPNQRPTVKTRFQAILLDITFLKLRRSSFTSGRLGRHWHSTVPQPTHQRSLFSLRGTGPRSGRRHGANVQDIADEVLAKGRYHCWRFISRPDYR